MFFEAHREIVEGKIASWLAQLKCPSPLDQACAYAVTSGGKRLRPVICLLVADALGQGRDVKDAALAVELFHTASLVADDLPCMDDDDQRRNRPSLHKVFGEAVAMLVSYGLISAAYEALWRNGTAMGDEGDRVCMLALENVTYNTGLEGATGGQFSDIFLEEVTEETLRDMVRRKTGALYEMAFVLGWLFGGGAPEQLPLVKKAAHHFGVAFQIADDISDAAQDKAHGRPLNFAALLGEEGAIGSLERELEGFQYSITALGLPWEEFVPLAEGICPGYSRGEIFTHSPSERSENSAASDRSGAVSSVSSTSLF